MRELTTVLLYTMKERLLKKSFIITNLIIFAIIVIMFNIPSIIEKTKGIESTEVLVVDSENIFEGSLVYLNEMGLGYDFKIQNEDITVEQLNTKINEGEAISGIVLYKTDEKINFDYIVSEINKGPDPSMLQNLFSNLYSNIEISKLDLTQEQLANINMQIGYELKTADGEELPTFSMSIILLSIALFFAIYFCAFQVSATITMEKTSKVMETLVTSTNPRAIILGKTIGTGIVGLIQLLATIAVSVASYKLFAEGQDLGGFLDFSQVTPMVIIVSLIYFILGYTLYSFLYALVGSTVSKPEDIQTANAPVAMISMLGFYFGYFTVILTPTNVMTKIASLVPFSSPFNMPFRMMMVDVPIGEVIASIAILLATILLVVHISIKIYSVAVLHYGNRIGIKEMIKLYKQK